MNIIKCIGKGCEEVFRTNDAVSPHAVYSCSKHTQKGADIVRFQEVAWDPEIGAGTDPKSYEAGRTGNGYGDFSDEKGASSRKQDRHFRNPDSRSKKGSISRALGAVAELPTEQQKQIMEVVLADDRDHQ